MGAAEALAQNVLLRSSLATFAGGVVDTTELGKLLHSVERLLERHAELKAQYAALKQAEQHWLEERVQLIGKNEMARQKVETMISQLKALEQDT